MPSTVSMEDNTTVETTTKEDGMPTVSNSMQFTTMAVQETMSTLMEMMTDDKDVTSGGSKKAQPWLMWVAIILPVVCFLILMILLIVCIFKCPWFQKYPAIYDVPPDGVREVRAPRLPKKSEALRKKVIDYRISIVGSGGRAIERIKSMRHAPRPTNTQPQRKKSRQEQPRKASVDINIEPMSTTRLASNGVILRNKERKMSEVALVNESKPPNQPFKNVLGQNTKTTGAAEQKYVGTSPKPKPIPRVPAGKGNTDIIVLRPAPVSPPMAQMNAPEPKDPITHSNESIPGAMAPTSPEIHVTDHSTIEGTGLKAELRKKFSGAHGIPAPPEVSPNIKEHMDAKKDEHATYANVPRQKNMPEWITYVQETKEHGEFSKLCIHRDEDTWITTETSFRPTEEEVKSISEALAQKITGVQKKFRRKWYQIESNDNDILVGIEDQGSEVLCLAMTGGITIAATKNDVDEDSIRVCREEVTYIKQYLSNIMT